MQQESAGAGGAAPCTEPACLRARGCSRAVVFSARFFLWPAYAFHVIKCWLLPISVRPGVAKFTLFCGAEICIQYIPLWTCCRLQSGDQMVGCSGDLMHISKLAGHVQRQWLNFGERRGAKQETAHGWFTACPRNKRGECLQSLKKENMQCCATCRMNASACYRMPCLLLHYRPGWSQRQPSPADQGHASFPPATAALPRAAGAPNGAWPPQRG